MVQTCGNSLTADGSGASQASLVYSQAAAAAAADQKVLHVLMLLLLTRLRLRCHGDRGGAVLVRHRPRKLLSLIRRRRRKERNVRAEL